MCARSQQNYNRIEHIARAILFSRYSDGSLMAMYSSYFDASGHRNQQPVMTVAGFVARVKKWNRFDSDWNGILRAEGVKQFHMTDFVSSEGEFKDWKGQTDRRREFVTKLAKCLKRNVIHSFRVTLATCDYDKINRTFELEETIGRPYTICSMQCIALLRAWAKDKNIKNEPLCFFEDGDKDKGDFELRHEQVFGIKPKFLSKKEIVAFQPADFAAWKIRNSVTQALKSDHTLAKGIELLRSIEQLQPIPKSAGVLHEASLLKFCSLRKVPKR